MTSSHQNFVAERYGARASDYVTSKVHAAGQDLDRIEAALRRHPAARVLDVGCGGGHVSYRAAAHAAEVVAVDLSAEMLDAVRRTAAERGLGNVTVRQCAAEGLPFADGAFDVVLSRFSAHHWSDFEAGLREARRVLAENGWAIFVDAVSPGRPLLDTHLQAVELLRDPTHVRNYSAAEWQGGLARAGFVVTTTEARRLRMELSSWLVRTRTSERNALAIRSIQNAAPADVRRHFAIEADGSFMLDALFLEAR